MVGAILTQNTAWKNVEKAIENLKGENLLSLHKLTRLRESQLARLIRPAGYFNVKARRLRNFLEFLRVRYGGNIRKMGKAPIKRLRRELLEVNGIGEETADSILLYALGKRSFVVDAYTRRIFSRHRYLNGDESYPTIKKIFSSHLPKSIPLYNDYHAQLVEVGKDYCRKTPRCALCPLRDNL
jgi:endonuclease-3 related protein